MQRSVKAVRNKEMKLSGVGFVKEVGERGRFLGGNERKREL